MAVLSVAERNQLLSQSRYKKGKSGKACKSGVDTIPKPTRKPVGSKKSEPERMSLADFNKMKEAKDLQDEADKGNYHLTELRRMDKNPDLIKKDREHYEQTSWLSWLYQNHPVLHEVTCAVANGGSRLRFEAVRLRAEGVKKGWPDTQTLEPMHNFPGMCIEFKKPKDCYSCQSAAKKAVSDDQILMLNRLRTRGFAVFVAYGFDEAVAITEAYINNSIDELDLFFSIPEI